MRRLIESWLPLREVNEDAGLEAGFKSTRAYFDPKLRNVHTWFARRPASVARVLTLAGTLGDSIQQSLFTDIVGFNAREIAKKRGMPPLLFYTTPKRSTVDSSVGQFTGRSSRNVTVVDPMAGGGSIPLESLRLGFRTIAVEYNPVAYLVLKATIEFPAKYADSGLFEETVKAARELLERAESELGRYYSLDSEGYIFARGVKCPHCRGLIPVEGVSPEITRDPRFNRRSLKIDFDRERKTFTVDTVNEKIERKPLERRGLNIRCPYCNEVFQLRGRSKTGQTLFDRWFLEHATLMRRVVEDLEEVTSYLEEEMIRIHIPLVKEVENGFKPVWGDEDEIKRFKEALKDLSREMLELQDYIPLDEIPKDNRWASTARNKGLTKWYMLFNPRQLLTIAKLSRIVAEIAEKQLSRNGEMGVAVSLYLAFAVDKVADYNTIATIWHGSRSVISPTIRGESTIDFRLEYAEVRRPKRSLGWAIELDVVESGGSPPALL